jgi:hypothetical protein
VQDAKSVSQRTGAEKLVLVVVALCLCIGVARLAAAAAMVPYAVYVGRAKSAAAKAAGVPAPTTTVVHRVAHSGPFASWWGGRRFPYREGGDYLGVISHSSTVRALGCLVGVAAERERAKGALVDRVIVPTDRVALYGQQSGAPMTLANGTEVRTSWGTLAQDAARITDVPVVEKTYDPVLSTDGAARVAANAGLVEIARDFSVGSQRSGASGTWIVRVRAGEPREFLMIPVEADPDGGPR